MSALETRPAERTGGAEPDPPRRIEIIEPREVPLGGPRAMTVRRTLPARGRTKIGAWCFLDHYGPTTSPPRAGCACPRTRTPACRPSPGCSPARSSTATRRATTLWSGPGSSIS